MFLGVCQQQTLSCCSAVCFSHYFCIRLFNTTGMAEQYSEQDRAAAVSTDISSERIIADKRTVGGSEYLDILASTSSPPNSLEMASLT
jgi:hypothetical protein